MKKDDRRTIIVVVVICGLCAFFAFILSHKSNIDKMEYVNDYEEFFAVSSEVSKFINYISVKDNDSTFNLLYDKYIDDNEINSSNIFNYFYDYNINDSFNATSIKHLKIGKNYLYLVEGNIIENTILDSIIINDNYKIVVLHDINNNSFTVYPVEDNYMDVVNSIKRIHIKSNSSNDMVTSNKYNDVDICKLYFSNYTNMLMNNIDVAYELLDDSMLKRFKSLNDFRNYVNNNSGKLTTSSSLCHTQEYDDGRQYVVIDKNENVYTFYEEAVMKYKVNFAFNKTEKSD